MSIPHRNFVGRMAGAKAFHFTSRRERSRRKHNGRMRPLPNMGLQKKMERHEMNRLDWVFGTEQGLRWLIDRMLEHRATHDHH